MKKKSVLPEKAQIPAAVVLCAVFLALVYVQFFRGGSDDTEITPTVAVESTAFEVSLTDLKEIMNEASTSSADENETERVLPSLTRDVFEEPDIDLEEVGDLESGADVAVAEQIPVEPPGPTRDERIQALWVTATCMLGDQVGAIVNGRFLREGDQIDGFTVRKIGERDVFLEDEEGLAVVSLPLPPWDWQPDAQKTRLSPSPGTIGKSLR